MSFCWHDCLTLCHVVSQIWFAWTFFRKNLEMQVKYRKLEGFLGLYAIMIGWQSEKSTLRPFYSAEARLCSGEWRSKNKQIIASLKALCDFIVRRQPERDRVSGGELCASTPLPPINQFELEKKRKLRRISAKSFVTSCNFPAISWRLRFVSCRLLVILRNWLFAL